MKLYKDMLCLLDQNVPISRFLITTAICLLLTGKFILVNRGVATSITYAELRRKKVALELPRLSLFPTWDN